MVEEDSEECKIAKTTSTMDEEKTTKSRLTTKQKTPSNNGRLSFISRVEYASNCLGQKRERDALQYSNIVEYKYFNLLL